MRFFSLLQLKVSNSKWILGLTIRIVQGKSIHTNYFSRSSDFSMKKMLKNDLKKRMDDFKPIKKGPLSGPR
jgi:hypothetical protein